MFPRLTLRQRSHNWHDEFLHWFHQRITHRQHTFAQVRFFAYEGDIPTHCACGTGLLVNRTSYDQECPSCGQVYEVAARLKGVSPVYSNLVVTVGKALLLQRLFGLSAAVAVGSIGVGTENTASAVGQTQLNPAGGGTVLIQSNDAGTSLSSGTINGFASGTTVTAQSTFGTGVANFTWAETGQFNGNTNATSTMFDRIAPIGPFTKSSSVSIVVQIQTTQS